jgi:hypothetical protein
MGTLYEELGYLCQYSGEAMDWMIKESWVDSWQGQDNSLL